MVTCRRKWFQKKRSKENMEMKRVGMLFAAAAALAASLCVADEPAEKKIYPVPPDKMAEFIAKTGGMIDPPPGGKSLVLLDAREKDSSTLSNLLVAAEMQLSISCEERDVKLAAADDPVKTAFGVRRDGAGAVVLFYEREGCPVLTAYPEDAVVLVNLQPLQDPTYNVYRKRLVKEFWRSVALALGGYGNQMQLMSALQPAFSVKDLDEVRGVSLSPLQINAIQNAKGKLGIFGKRSVPYSRACREGWAPPPTNDVQRALYNRFNDPASRFRRDFRPKVKMAP